MNREDDPDFRATFAYYGGALFQALMTFTDESSCCAHVYVPLPTSETAPPPSALTGGTGLT